MNKRQGAGFTIVELLIAIVVIAVLASVTVAAYSGMQNRGKDAERQTDIRQIAQQLEMYYQDYGYYPPFHQTTVGINIAAWRAATMPNLKDALLTPPGVSAPSLVNNTTPTASQYGYHNNGSCVGSQCSRYRLYWRSDADGHIEVYTGASG